MARDLWIRIKKSKAVFNTIFWGLIAVVAFKFEDLMGIIMEMMGGGGNGGNGTTSGAPLSAQFPGMPGGENGFDMSMILDMIMFETGRGVITLAILINVLFYYAVFRVIIGWWSGVVPDIINIGMTLFLGFFFYIPINGLFLMVDVGMFVLRLGLFFIFFFWCHLLGQSLKLFLDCMKFRTDKHIDWDEFEGGDKSPELYDSTDKKTEFVPESAGNTLQFGK